MIAPVLADSCPRAKSEPVRNTHAKNTAFSKADTTSSRLAVVPGAGRVRTAIASESSARGPLMANSQRHDAIASSPAAMLGPAAEATATTKAL